MKANYQPVSWQYPIEIDAHSARHREDENLGFLAQTRGIQTAQSCACVSCQLSYSAGIQSSKSNFLGSPLDLSWANLEVHYRKATRFYKTLLFRKQGAYQILQSRTYVNNHSHKCNSIISFRCPRSGKRQKQEAYSLYAGTLCKQPSVISVVLRCLRIQLQF